MAETPFFRVMHRPRLFMGGEREPTMVTAIVAGALAASGLNMVSIGIAALLWFGSIGFFRQMAKADPQMTQIYRRHRKYRVYYPPRSRPYRDEEKPSWLFYSGIGLVMIVGLWWLL